ncbi:MAG TPA: lysylphosphatidylglycerol synthase domain-containing protein, partial [Kofleriaceae bacterium]|nr:lysylphosphatidylglycerol synthase domain-containing protein [Kofleriaceae bacterium]
MADASAPASAAAPRPKHSWLWLVTLLAIGIAGLYLAAPDGAILGAALARLRDAPAAALAIVIGGALGLVATEALRIGVIARLAGARTSARDAWDAAVANHVMTAVTPQVGLGEPTVAYTLARRGVPWDAAVCVPFVKFTTSLALVFALGAGLVALGHGPTAAAAWMTGTAIAWFGAIALVSLAVVAVCGSPRLAARWIRSLDGWARRRRLLAGARWQTRIARTSDVAVRTVDRLAVMRGAAGP